MSQLVDVNLLLALVTDRHVHHRDAVLWIDKVPARNAVICRTVQLGLLRLLNNPAVMKEDAIPASACWTLWRHLLEDERVRFEAGEPGGLEAVFEEFTQDRTFSPRLWSDAYLAAYARAGEYALVTFDRGFRSFGRLNCTVLSYERS